jgi:hypothetical protein
MESSPRRGSLVGPVVLIGIGVLFLLSNLGAIRWSVWDALWRLWPILLIAAGLDLVIGRRGTWANWLLILALLALVFGAIWIFTRMPVSEGRTEQVRQALEGAERAEVVIDAGVGRLSVGSPTADGVLVSGSVELLPGLDLRQDSSESAGTAHYRIESEGSWGFPSFRWDSDVAWDLRLTEAIPMTLQVDAGVGEADLDLSALQITDLTVDLGVGKTTLTLPATGHYRASIDTGVGEAVITLPPGLAARIRVSNGLGDVQVLGDFDRQDDVYTTPGFDQADNRVELNVSGGIGRIVIRGN